MITIIHPPRAQNTVATAAASEAAAIEDASPAAAESIRRFLAIPSNASLSQHLRAITAQPHLAGTAGDYATTLFVAAKFREYGLDEVSMP